MKFVIVYLTIGMIVSFIISELDKIKLDGEEEEELIDNYVRVIHIVIWPLMVYWIGKEIISGDSSSDHP